jgi:hypothetical protein
MTFRSGTMVLMGSGELTATMVEVHKELLQRFGPSPKAVFLDTPAGFQLNAGQISRRAVDYFENRVGYPMTVASFRSAKASTPFQAETAYHQLREADYILIGPGSPTYALRQFRATPIPKILADTVVNGGCLVAASAAVLTMGRMTLPVYEIYKVGQELHWVEGADVLGALGFNLVVVPHWNNAEGGTHDTRFCFMGQERFDRLAGMLPEDVSLIGIDEHTACIIDFESAEARVKGLGEVLLRRGERELIFGKGDRFPIEALKGKLQGKGLSPRLSKSRSGAPTGAPKGPANPFWDSIHALRQAFLAGVERNDSQAVVNALLELDRSLWQAQESLENEEFISQGREILRDMIVLLGPALESRPAETGTLLRPMIEELLALRETLRNSHQWEAADTIRSGLERIGFAIEDTPDGARWRLERPE